MIILVVGNGFDLAHQLPTKYRHFLEFIRIYKGEQCVVCNDENDLHHKIQRFVNELKSRHDKCALEAKEIIEAHNRLLDHFLDVYINRCDRGKEGWIDFESEISDIIKLFDRAYTYIRERESNGQDITLPESLYFKIAPFLFANKEYRKDKRYEFQLGVILEQADNLLLELNDITRLFEIYLTEFVEKMETELRIPEIYIRCKKADAVLSFNYTDTYRRLYRGSEMTDCCFIHGKAKKESDRKNSNLILGIDEYLDVDRRNNDNQFIRFKKFYQRINKETDSQYIDWLDADIAENKMRKEKMPLYIYFYGHSLDVTDKDILQKLIMHENAIVNIFYHRKDEMGKQIINLTKIIGEDNLIQMTRGSKRRINFLQASSARSELMIKVLKNN